MSQHVPMMMRIWCSALCAGLIFTACRQEVPPEAAFIRQVPMERWDSAFSTLSPEEQMVAFRYALTQRHPGFDLGGYMVEQGATVLPVVRSQLLVETDGEFITSLLAVLGDIRCQKQVELPADVLDVVRPAVAKIDGPKWRKDAAVYHAKRALEGACEIPYSEAVKVSPLLRP